MATLATFTGHPRTATTPTWVTGNFGDALGTGAVATTTDTVDTIGTPGVDAPLGTGTVEMWVKAPAASALKLCASHQQWWWIGHNSSGQAIARYGKDTDEGDLNSTAQIADGSWHHIALVINAGAGSLYVDGNRVATNAAVKNSKDTGTSRFNLGGFYDSADAGNISGFDWPGAIDEVRTSSVARYTGTTYTVPTGPFTVDADTTAIFHLNSDLTSDASEPPPEDVPVTATAPTRVDLPGTASDTYTIPTTTGVEYRISGVAKAAGTYSSEGATSLTVTAVATEGYTLIGASSWSLTWSTAEPPPATRYRLAFEPLVWDGSAYPERHPGAASATYIGPGEPADWQPNDLWFRKDA